MKSTLKEKVLEFIRTSKIFYWYKIFFYQLNINNYNKIPLDRADLNDYIKNLLNSDKPIMISRLGSNELNTLKYNYNKTKYPDNLKHAMKNNAGFFPLSDTNLDKFSEIYFNSLHNIDVLGIWFNPFEDIVCNEFCAGAELTELKNLEPYFSENPWSYGLKGMRVLVIHPFEESIKLQYNKRKDIFKNQDVLPDFHLITYPAIQSIGGNSEFESWFEALDKMKNDVAKIEFDIAIIGAGAYGLPLASFIKELGKKAIHLGGSTQMLFGVYGRRWELNPNFKNIINDQWIKPIVEEKPVNASNVENACYW